MPPGSIFDIASSGMDAQSMRLRVVAENLANQDTTGSTPGADPYRRKTVTFQPFDATTGEEGVSVADVGTDQTPFEQRYEPSHPAANAQGYVKLPNVNSFVEMMDMREAERSYGADLDVIQMTRQMFARALDIIR